MGRLSARCRTQRLQWEAAGQALKEAQENWYWEYVDLRYWELEQARREQKLIDAMIDIAREIGDWDRVDPITKEVEEAKKKVKAARVLVLGL
jgi:hypothetical protein